MKLIEIKNIPSVKDKHYPSAEQNLLDLKTEFEDMGIKVNDVIENSGTPTSPRFQITCYIPMKYINDRVGLSDEPRHINTVLRKLNIIQLVNEYGCNIDKRAWELGSIKLIISVF